MLIKDMKKELEKIKQDIKNRHANGEDSDELVLKVVECTSLARRISERMKYDAI